MKPNQSTSEVIAFLALALLGEKSSANTRDNLIVAEVNKCWDAQFYAQLAHQKEGTKNAPSPTRR